MATITISFSYTRGFQDQTDSVDFETDPSIVSDIDTHAEDWVNEENAKLDDNANQWELEGWEVEDWEHDYPDPNGFVDLDEYSEFVAKCDEHGPGYRLRHEDIGDFDFDDQFNGCWDSEEEFAQQLYEDCYDIPDHLQHYIDWESVAREVLMDYSSYEHNGDYYIFRD